MRMSMSKQKIRTRVYRILGVLVSLSFALTTLVACGGSSSPTTSSPTPTNLTGISKIKHIIVIMQENRSFDSYFGTYPGADGIPMQNGVPTVCINDPATQQCVKPYHDAHDLNGGGPHGANNASADIDGGKMDGFVTEAEHGRRGCTDNN